MTVTDRELDQLIAERQVRLMLLGPQQRPIWEASPSPLHQIFVRDIEASIRASAASSDSCTCEHIADAYIRLPDSSLVRPDIAIFCAPIPRQREAYADVPAAIIEIVSPNYEAKDYEELPPVYLATVRAMSWSLIPNKVCSLAIVWVIHDQSSVYHTSSSSNADALCNSLRSIAFQCGSHLSSWRCGSTAGTCTNRGITRSFFCSSSKRAWKASRRRCMGWGKFITLREPRTRLLMHTPRVGGLRARPPLAARRVGELSPENTRVRVLFKSLRIT